MRTIAQQKARINGWIKTYEQRMEQYKQAYGYDSIAARIQVQRCRYRIRLWKQQIERLSNSKAITKQEVVKKVLELTETYFEQKLTYNRGHKIETAPLKYYISKFVVDNGLLNKYTASILQTASRKAYERRDVLTHNKEHKNAYRAYRLTIEAELKAANIIYK